MQQRFIVGSVCAIAAATWMVSAPVAAQGGGGQVDPAAALVETPRDANGHPVLTGVWANTGGQALTTEADGSFRRTLRGRKAAL
ncbi:MAG: hypothetical protein O2930_05575 [Acidobacteria bacterium]|nr:hypothetical protein [Acidobacteriota bacterium]